jgi:hypothetical protein
MPGIAGQAPKSSAALRFSPLLVASTLAVLLSACGAARTYSDDAINAAKRLASTNSDDVAIRFLDDAAAAGTAVAAEQAAIGWSQRLVPIRDRILGNLTAAPDDAARVRSFVVGTTCDVFSEASSWPGGIVPSTRISEIVDDNRVGSGLPAMAGYAELAADLVSSISDALADGDIGGAVPGVSQALLCQIAGG